MFKYIDTKKYNLFLVAPFIGPCFDIIENMGGNCVEIPPPKILRGHGGAILQRGLLYKVLTGLAIVRYTFSLISFIRKNDIDVCHCNSIRSLLTIGFASKILRKPCIWYIKGELDNRILDTIGFIIANKILFLSNTIKTKNYQRIISFFNNKIDILKIGIDLDHIKKIEETNKDQLKQELGIDNRTFNMAYLGVVAPYKGITYLVKALASIKKEISDFKLYIVGDHCVEEYKDYQHEIDQLVIDHGLSKNIVFTGWRVDALNILFLMDTYVLPSLSEGVPRSIMEAMVLRKPVVATNVGGVREIVQNNETGFVVEPKDAQALSNAILRLAHDEDMRRSFGKKAKETVVDHCSITKNVDSLEKHYAELTST